MLRCNKPSPDVTFKVRVKCAYITTLLLLLHTIVIISWATRPRRRLLRRRRRHRPTRPPIFTPFSAAPTRRRLTCSNSNSSSRTSASDVIAPYSARSSWIISRPPLPRPTIPTWCYARTWPARLTSKRKESRWVSSKLLFFESSLFLRSKTFKYILI